MKYIELIVLDILSNNPEARDDDDLLFCEYLKTIDYEDFSDLAEQIRCRKILSKFKSVARARRKLQQGNPFLWGKRRWDRQEAQEAFETYARENC